MIQMASGGPVKEDMFASFTSAFGAAKRTMGHEDTMIVVRRSHRREPKVRNFRNVVVNGVLTRYHSKSWRDRVLQHGYSGVLEFGDMFKAMRSTEAALGNTISPELWKRTVEVTVEEWERIADANPHKTREMGELCSTRNAAACGKTPNSSNNSKTNSTNSTPTSNSPPTAANSPNLTPTRPGVR